MQRLKEIISETGFLEIESVLENPSSDSYLDDRRPSSVVDFKVVVKTGAAKSLILLLETMKSAPPRIVRDCISRLQDTAGKTSKIYSIICAPFLSPASRELCRDNGMGYMDLSGNSYLKFDNVFIKTSGYPNPNPNTRPLKALWSDKSTRVLRVLLCDPGREWYVKDLSEEAGVSLGQTSNVKRFLLDYDYALEVPGGRKNRFRLDTPEKLLKDWAEAYSYTRNNSYPYYTLENIHTIEEKLATFCDNCGMEYAFTLTSADVRLTQFIRGSEQAFIYIEKPLEPAASYSDLDEAAIAGTIQNGPKEDDSGCTLPFDLKEVDSGANVTVLIPYDKGVFYGSRKVQGVNIVSDIQLYLDLNSFKQRGKDTAEFLLDRRIRPAWQT